MSDLNLRVTPTEVELTLPPGHLTNKKAMDAVTHLVAEFRKTAAADVAQQLADMLGFDEETADRPATHRFKPTEVNDDTEWFRTQKDRDVVVTKVDADGTANGFFKDDGLPFAGISLHRLEPLNPLPSDQGDTASRRSDALR